jgi:membrane-associated phospholipid phosphatase
MDDQTNLTPPPDATVEIAAKAPPSFFRKYRHFILAGLSVLGLVIVLALLPENIRVALVYALQTQGYLVALALIFGLVALSLLWSTGERIDQWVFLYFNLRGHRWPRFDWLMLGATQMGNGIFAFILGAVLFFVSDRRIAYEVVLGTLALWILVELVKAGVRRPRPFERLTQTRIVGYKESGRSFPSGHTSQVFFLVTLLSQYYQFTLWAVLLLYGLALFVAVTRMYVGAHYPRDVLAGAMLGSVCGLVGVIVDQHFPVGRG